MRWLLDGGSLRTKGIGSLASRLERRRFRLDDAAELAVGERVVVGVSELALVKAASVAYALPLATALMAGGLAQWLAGSDAISLVAAVGGLIAGLILARLTARRLGAQRSARAAIPETPRPAASRLGWRVESGRLASNLPWQALGRLKHRS
ncbi:MAG: SoxR reducing system RseC family protein [Chromatiales bacterium]|nr:SoxR reducing system RseC family protein [Chromatiales bacterium]